MRIVSFICRIDNLQNSQLTRNYQLTENGNAHPSYHYKNQGSVI